jgi:uncharacterized protein YdeI (BOF family)
MPIVRDEHHEKQELSSMNKLFSIVAIAAVVGGGTWYVTRAPQPQADCCAAPGKMTQAAAASDPGPKTTPIGSLTAAQKDQKVQIEGTIAQECPHTGCWAVIKDDTGQIRIDTNDGGFTLPLRQDGHKIRVVGKLKVKVNGDLEISATAAEVK